MWSRRVNCPSPWQCEVTGTAASAKAVAFSPVVVGQTPQEEEEEENDGKS